MAEPTAFEPTGTLDDVVPAAREPFEALLEQAEDWGMAPRIRSAGRTCAMQQALHAQGPGVTGAALCRSWHVLGRALDLDLDPHDCRTYERLGRFWEAMGGTWGGRWSSFGACGDQGHFHWPEEAGQQAVPRSICDAATLDECEAVREAYLERASGGMRLAALAGVALAAAGAWLLWKSAVRRAP